MQNVLDLSATFRGHRRSPRPNFKYPLRDDANVYGRRNPLGGYNGASNCCLNAVRSGEPLNPLQISKSCPATGSREPRFHVRGIVESPPFPLPANRVEALFLAFSQSLGATDVLLDATSCGSEEEGGRLCNWPSSLKFFRKHGRGVYCTCLESRHRLCLSKVRILLLPPLVSG